MFSWSFGCVTISSIGDWLGATQQIKNQGVCPQKKCIILSIWGPSDLCVAGCEKGLPMALVTMQSRWKFSTEGKPAVFALVPCKLRQQVSPKQW